jgi:hypothetical protein
MSGALASFFLGGARVQLVSDTSTAIATHPSNATAAVNITNAGVQSGTDGGPYNWLKGGIASNYEIMATLISGTVTGDAFGSWLNLGTSRVWSLTETGIGTKLGSITLQIRPVGGSVLTTATINFDAEVN